MRRPYGKISFSGLLFVAGLVGGIWWVVNYAGLYLDHLEVRDAVRSAINTLGKPNQSINEIRLGILLKVNAQSVGEHEEDDGFGVIRRVKGLGLKDDAVVIDRDEVNKTVRVAIDYDRKIILKPQGTVKVVHFHYEKSGPSPD